MVLSMWNVAMSLPHHISTRPPDHKPSAHRPTGAYLYALFDHLTDGLVLLDQHDMIIAVNPAFYRDILRQHTPPLEGQPYATLFTGQHEGQLDEWVAIDDIRLVMASRPLDHHRCYSVERFAVSQDTDYTIEQWHNLGPVERLMQADREAWLHRVAACLAHEIGNPLQSIHGCLDLCVEEREISSEARAYVELARKELARITELLEYLRELYQPASDLSDDVDLRKLIAEAIPGYTQNSSLESRTSSTIGE
jgi:nitrogen-specific signal transduction histidine kinase